MNIALLGFGQTGHLIKQVAEERGHEIAAIFNSQQPLQSVVGTDKEAAVDFKSIDLFIDFSIPTAVATNVDCISQLKKPLVIGTSGWYEQLPQVKERVVEAGIGCIYAHNFSLGMNLFFQIAEEAMKRIDAFAQYDVAIHETHHRRKVDSPSGTALKLGELILENSTTKDQIITESIQGRIPETTLHISSLRIGSVPGTHTVGFDSEIDSITLTHTSRDRTGYALGAVMAAEWIVDRTGFYTMCEFLNEFIGEGERGLKVNPKR